MIKKIVEKANEEARCFYRRTLSVTEGIMFSGTTTNPPTKVSCIAELLGKYAQQRIPSMGLVVAVNYTLREWRSRTKVSEKIAQSIFHHLETHWDYGKFIDPLLLGSG